MLRSFPDVRMEKAEAHGQVDPLHPDLQEEKVPLGPAGGPCGQLCQGHQPGKQEGKAAGTCGFFFGSSAI